MKRIIIITVCLLALAMIIVFESRIYRSLSDKFLGNKSVESITEEMYDSANVRLKINLDNAGLKDFPDKLIIVGFKEEQLLQVYADTHAGIKYIKQYPFTAMSGGLGPKLQRGDLQIPEGIYGIEYLNPNSSYYLSMKISYPNTFDKSKSSFANVADMGDNIFIHGKDVTVGCIPIGDEAIEEVFLLVQKARVEDVKVIVSPRDFRVNEAYPIISGIDWEGELYGIIEAELDDLPRE